MQGKLILKSLWKRSCTDRFSWLLEVSKSTSPNAPVLSSFKGTLELHTILPCRINGRLSLEWTLGLEGKMVGTELLVKTPSK